MRCKDCEYVKCYAVNKRMYYCDHEDRKDLIGKLGEDILPDVSPVWCPMVTAAAEDNITDEKKGSEK